MPKKAYQIEWIDCYSDFSAIQSSWNTLAEQYSPFFFFRHEWFDAAWPWVAQDHSIRLLTASFDQALVGVLPLMLKKQNKKGIQFTLCEFLSIPDTQFCDLIVHPEHPEVAKMLLQALMSNSDWDKFKGHYLRPDSLLAQSLEKHFPKEYYIEESTSHPIVFLEGDWTSFYSGKSRRFKKGNNLARNHLQKNGQVEVVELHNLPEKQIIQTIQYISEMSWKKQTQTTFDHDGPLAFIQKLTKICHENNWLKLWGLKLNDQIIAYEYEISYQKSIHALRSDYISEHAALSPGTYLNWQVLERLFSEEFTHYFMGPGENTYKLRWQNAPEPVFTAHVYNRTLSAKLLKTLEQHIAPKVRPIKAQLDNFIKEKVT